MGKESVAHTCNPGYVGGWDQKNHSSKQASLGKKRLLAKLHLEENMLVWWHTPVIQQWEDHSPGSPGQKARPHLQENQSQSSWGYASSSGTPASQAWSPEFKPQFCPEKKKGKWLK
jgi:hypothetical protein